jgi:hypothetical protein
MLNIIKILMILLVFTFLMPFGSTMSYAWGGHSGGGGHHGGGGGYHGGGWGHGYRGGWYGGGGYYGLGYNYWPYDYYDPYYNNYGVLVSSPVVETPEIIEPSPTVVTNNPTYQNTAISPVQITSSEIDDDITLNIPNSKGGYTSVLLKRSGKGFTGPQGEFYSEFPRVSQLKVMYGQ